jgi:putative oxidoreductase
LEELMDAIAGATPAMKSRALHYSLWFAQMLLAVVFTFVGIKKLMISSAELTQLMPGGAVLPLPLIRFIGVAEVAGAIGLLLPSATRILPVLTAVAAGALALVMALAALFHVSRAEFGSLPGVFVLGALALFVAWGRISKAPIPARR